MYKKSRRPIKTHGQAALDFLLSWGIVLVITAIAVAVLFGLGVFSAPRPQTLISGFQGVQVTDAAANGTMLVVDLNNDFGQSINLGDVQAFANGKNVSALQCSAVQVAAESTALCRLNVSSLQLSSTYQVSLTIRYSPSGSNLPVSSNGTISSQLVPAQILQQLNNVTTFFEESNLPASSTWSVTVDGMTKRDTVSGSGSGVINFSLPFGVYDYNASNSTASQCTGVHSSPSKGTFDTGSTTFIIYQGTCVTYFSSNVAPFDVTYDGQTNSSSTTELSFTTVMGSFPYTIPRKVQSPACSYSVSPSSGSLTAGTSQAISYSASNCVTTFTESGLPSGASWTVVYNGTSQTSTSTTADFAMPPGTYSFTAGTSSASGCSYSPSPSSGSLAAGSSQSISYTQFCSTDFSESGLPSGTYWTITYDNFSVTTNYTSVSYGTSPGTYSFTAGASSAGDCSYYPSPSSGSLTVGSSQSIIYTERNCYTIFLESGLPSGTSWTVVYNGTSQTSTSTGLEYGTSPGTYSFTAGTSSAGSCTYLPSPSSGSLAAGSLQSISYTNSSPCIS